jgi:hypothetical protein
VRELRFLPEAQAELMHEIEYYSIARSGAGVRFQSAVESAPEMSIRHPLGGAPSPRHTRSVLVKGFPFSVVYRADESELLVVAITPHKRRPGYWLARLGDC